MPDSAAELHAAIQALQAQRAVLGAAVVDTAVATLRAQLATLAAASAPTLPALPAQALRQVTILFLDIVGSTTLSQRLDPEEVHAVVDGALARCTRLVEGQGGKVLQYAGDNLLAVFGAEGSHEDDAQRAVHAGLALLAEGRTLGAEVLAAHGHAGFNVRVGLHTGGVLLGGGVDAEGSIRGMAVNVAARMEQTAPPGALRISQDTYRQVQGVFDVQAQDPIVVKGLDEPVTTWLVQRARPRTQRGGPRGVEGVATALVGRQAQLQVLQAAWQRLHEAPAAGQARLALQLVVAEAGLGKSRLLQSLGEWAASWPTACHHFRGRADPQTQGQPYGLLRDMLARQLLIDETDSPAVTRQKMEDGIAPLFMADDGPALAQAHAHLLGHLIGIDFSDSPHLSGILEDPAQMRSRAFHAAAQALRRISLADGCPLFIALDDLHWADEGTLDFLDHLCRVNHDVPTLILGLARPTLFERRPAWRERHAGSAIELQPLDAQASTALAMQLLSRLPQIPAELLALLTTRAAGNPFFMEELVKMLVDQGALRMGEQGWTLNAGRLLPGGVPSTLTGVVQARLDSLPATERLALQQASVIGMVFWEPALAELDPAAPPALPALVQRQLTLPRDASSLADAREYAFAHHILREVAYDTVLKRYRQLWHARTAAWLSALSGLRAEGLLGLAAEHFERAGDAPRACEHYTRAAESARRKYAHDTTLRCVAAALPLTAACTSEQAPLLRWRLLDARERTLDLQGRRAEQRQDLQELAELAETLDDDRRRADLATRRCLLALRGGDVAGAEQAAREAMRLAARAGDIKLRLNAHRLLADTLARQGQVAQALALANEGLVEVRATGLLGLESRFLNALTVIHAQRGDLMALLENCQQATRLRHELGDRRNEAIGLATLGGIWMALGQHAQAEAALRESLKLHRAVGDRGQEPVALANLSQLALWQGEIPQALDHARQAHAVAAEVQARELEAFALWCLGQAELAQGQITSAESSFAAALVAAQATGSAYALDAQAGLARVALLQGDQAEALRHAEALLLQGADSSALQACLARRLVELSAWQVLHHAGDARTPGLLRAAHQSLQDSAGALADPALRQGMLTGVPEHRQLMAAWAQISGAA